MEEPSRKKPGRPATGHTPKRNVRLGAVWDRAEELARVLGEEQVYPYDRGFKSMAPYVDEALRRENARVERLLRKRDAERNQTGGDTA